MGTCYNEDYLFTSVLFQKGLRQFTGHIIIYMEEANKLGKLKMREENKIKSKVSLPYKP